MTNPDDHTGGTATPDPGPPRLPVSCGAIVRDRQGRLLIVKPTYKKGWTLPGGIMEANGETPWEACQREVREETGLELRAGRLAAVDTRPARPDRPLGIRFLFDAGALPDDVLAAARPQESEIAEIRLLPATEALPLLRKAIRRRVSAVIDTAAAVYLEDGDRVDGIG
ncbi:MAG: NUDIX hydrolase [Tetrasphaera sp.]